MWYSNTCPCSSWMSHCWWGQMLCFPHPSEEPKYMLIPCKFTWVFLSGIYFPAAAKLLQSCPTLCDPIDGSPPGSTIPGILQARTLEWAAISFSNAWKWKVKVKSLSHVQLFATPWPAAYQAPPSMGFARQGYYSGLPLPSPPGHEGTDLSFCLTIRQVDKTHERMVFRYWTRDNVREWSTREWDGGPSAWRQSPGHSTMRVKWNRAQHSLWVEKTNFTLFRLYSDWNLWFVAQSPRENGVDTEKVLRRIQWKVLSSPQLTMILICTCTRGKY